MKVGSVRLRWYHCNASFRIKIQKDKYGKANEGKRKPKKEEKLPTRSQHIVQRKRCLKSHVPFNLNLQYLCVLSNPTSAILRKARWTLFSLYSKNIVTSRYLCMLHTHSIAYVFFLRVQNDKEETTNLYTYRRLFSWQNYYYIFKIEFSIFPLFAHSRFYWMCVSFKSVSLNLSFQIDLGHTKG